jgi:hypothetical protein
VGAWGPGIFSNDTSADVRGDFRELIEDGLSTESATAKILADYTHAAEDPDDRTSFWTGLAATQFQLGRLLPDVRDKTIEIINAGGDLHLWGETGPTQTRRAALVKLTNQLLGPQKEPVTVKPPRKIFSPVEAGVTVAWNLPDGYRAYLRVLGVKEWRRGSYPILEVVDPHGGVYMQAMPISEERQPARYAVIEGRVTHVPKPDDLRILKQEKPRPVADPRSYTDWRGLATTCRRLLDDPGARPRSG